MKRPLSPTPTLSMQLDRITRDREAGSGPAETPAPRWRYASDLIGMAMFFVLLGTYLAAHL